LFKPALAKKSFTLEAQRRKEGAGGVEYQLVLRASFAPLRLCVSSLFD
jgi:hypothetical protein